jgi:hypothetical protein
VFGDAVDAGTRRFLRSSETTHVPLPGIRKPPSNPIDLLRPGSKAATTPGSIASGSITRLSSAVDAPPAHYGAKLDFHNLFANGAAGNQSPGTTSPNKRRPVTASSQASVAGYGGDQVDVDNPRLAFLRQQLQDSHLGLPRRTYENQGSNPDLVKYFKDKYLPRDPQSPQLDHATSLYFYNERFTTISPYQAIVNQREERVKAMLAEEEERRQRALMHTTVRSSSERSMVGNDQAEVGPF